jgi:hypothetical protein
MSQLRKTQKKVTVTASEYIEIVEAERRVKLNGPNFIITVARIVNNNESYADIKPHIARHKCGDIE